jgi:hypothetical protein
VLLSIVVIILGAASAHAITRDSVLSRAQVRIDKPVPYSQAKYYAGYRTDCSGYVSMCWATGSSYNTRTFYKITNRIPVASLQPGDAMLKKGYHVRLFYGWLDDAHTRYVSYESAYSVIAGTRVHSIAEDLKFGYVPVRYKRIQASPKPNNILRNPALNVWAKSWSSSAEQPLWWEATSPGWQTAGSTWKPAVKKRTDVYRTARNSLELVNPSPDPEHYAELSQTTPVVPGATYRFKAWGRTATDPSRVQLALTYLDAAGMPVAESTAAAGPGSLSANTFRAMSVLLTAPPEAVSARTVVRLAGGATASGVTTLTGSAVTLDDISLYRPAATASIKGSRTRAYNGNTVVVSGSITPTPTVGLPATAYIKRPGSTTWSKLAAPTIYAKNGGGAVRLTYRFTRSMRRGVYQFRITVPAVPGYLGRTSNAVRVTLR